MSVQVIHGINVGQFDVAGQSVDQVAKAIRDVFNVPTDSSAFVNGHAVRNTHILVSGDTLEFLQTFGRKDGVSDYWSVNELKDWFGEEKFNQMLEAGMEPEMQPVFPKDEVMKWFYKSVGERDDPFRHIRVDIDGATITCDGKSRHIDKDLAAVAQSLLNAKGATRTSKLVNKEFEEYVHDLRIDQLIKKLKTDYKDEIGKYIRSQQGKGYWLEAHESE